MTKAENVVVRLRNDFHNYDNAHLYYALVKILNPLKKDSWHMPVEYQEALTKYGYKD